MIKKPGIGAKEGREMSGRTHALVPAAIAATLFQADPLLTLTAALAGLAPDIDEPWSVIGTRLWFLAWWIKYVFGHRTISHSFMMVGVAAIIGLAAMMPWTFVVAICLGLGSHLVLDALSGGVQLWWPKKERWVLGRYAVYGPLDRVLMVGGMVVTVGLLLVRLGSEVTTVSGHADDSGETEQLGRR
jgi:inner membrane protein